MTRLRLLDLFSGAGGAARGYQQAGFYVVGVDIVNQPRYAGDEFIKADALTLMDDLLNGWPTSGFASGYTLDEFAAIHASPPCQHYSRGRTRNPVEVDHPQLIEPTRQRLAATGLPYVMENVEGAPLTNPVMLCGAAFGLAALCHDGRRRPLKRHRLFESNVWLMSPGCACSGAEVIGVYGNGGMCTPRHNGRRKGYQGSKTERAQTMDINWMTRAELNEAIPPAYTRFIGEQLLAHLTTGVSP